MPRLGSEAVGMLHGELEALDFRISNVCMLHAFDLLTVCHEELFRNQAIAKSTVVNGGIIKSGCITPPQARIVGRRIVR
jgi:hypothetical protein